MRMMIFKSRVKDKIKKGKLLMKMRMNKIERKCKLKRNLRRLLRMGIHNHKKL
jgi:hypothetical protein